MNKKILDILEFDKVKQLFEPYLQTEQGEMELAALTPTDKKESIETAFMELEDMEQILLEEPRFAVSTIQDVRPVAKRLEMEAALNIDELLALKAVPPDGQRRCFSFSCCIPHFLPGAHSFRTRRRG